MRLADSPKPSERSPSPPASRQAKPSNWPSLRSLAKEQLRQRRLARVVQTLDRVRSWIPHPPSPTQREFLALDCEEAGYGGAAGGGKTDALLIAALQYVDRPTYSAALFRRQKEDWEQAGSALKLAERWLAGTPARWDAAARSFVFPSGAQLHFGFASNMRQLVQRYQGSQYQFIGFDELTQWPEAHYLYLFSRLRRLAEDMEIPTRARAAFNPGGVGHQWVKRRFVENAKHIGRGSDLRADIRARGAGGVPMPSPRVYENPPSDEARKLAAEEGRSPQGVFFVPAFLEDNPGLDVAGYRAQLSKLDPVTRAQLQRADWDAVPSGQFFRASDFGPEVFLDAPPVGLRWLRSWDWAASVPSPNTDPDWTVGAKLAVQRFDTGEMGLVIGDVYRFQKLPGDVEREVRACAERDGKLTRILLEQEPGAAGKTVVHGMKTRVLFGFAVDSFLRTGPKEEYWRPLATLVRTGGVRLVRGPWNSAFVEELTHLPVGHDDQADAVGAGLAWLTQVGNGAERTRALAGMR